MRLQGKVALITGSSRGIGRAVAERFAQEGAFVVVHSSKESEAAFSTLKSIVTAGGNAIALATDLSSVGGIREFFLDLDRELADHLGSSQIDILVNNAGVNATAPYDQMTEEQFDLIFAVNVKGAFFMTQMALVRLRDRGRIINISSFASRHASPSPYTLTYSMTKGALDAFTVALAGDLGKRGITANTIAPATVETDMNRKFITDPKIRRGIEVETALGRIGRVDDIADVALFLASEESRWVTGQYIEATGGFRL